MISKENIYKSFLCLLEEHDNLTKKLEQISSALKGFFLGSMSSNNYSEMNNNQSINKIEMPLELNLKEGSNETMKYKGVTIFKNPRCNSYYARYRENGKQRFVSGKTQSEVLSELKLRLNHVEKHRSSTTLKMWYERWLQLFKINKVKQTTLDDYFKILKNIPDKIMDADIRKISSLEIVTLLNGITKERTRQKVYELLFALFDKAKKFEVVNKNILDIIDKPKHEREKGIALDIEQQHVFIRECLKHKYCDVYLLALYQGLRIGEILGITGNDIDLIKNELNIDKSVNNNNELDTTKNKQSVRVMPIFNKSKEMLKKYANYGNQRLFNFSYWVAQKGIKEILIKTNLPDISIHDLRHTFITNCKNINIPEHIIQLWVGHEIGSKVTAKVYTHPTASANIENIALYNDLIF